MSLEDRHMLAGKLADPAFRRDRARKARAAQSTLDYHLTRAAELVASSAPPPGPDIVARLRALLPPVDADRPTRAEAV